MPRRNANKSFYLVLSKVENTTEGTLLSENNGRRQACNGLSVLGVDVGEDCVLSLKK